MIHKCVDSVVFHIWPPICSFTLLTVTALSVVWILRKRRSSILKSQRPARTPFSELEFNVATPTDTAKSRRVSFSRRTGVAEFVTNEATTTWKNPNEEHNKSLELFSNDSEANASQQPVGHLGKRIFDQQFAEVEAVDFISGLVNGSLNNVDFSQQLAPLECTADGKLTAPQNKFELSAFTEQSKLFGNDFIAPSIGDNSGRIDVDFPATQQIEKDDLDEIQNDLNRGPSNMGCHGTFSNGQNMLEYIEEDLNTTHVIKNDEYMSITDTVNSPVQDVSKSASKDKKDSLNNDWVADKGNIAMNTHAAPCETNFAVNEESNQVLVVDGKRLTLQPYLPEDSDTNKNHKTTVFDSDEDNISMIQALSSHMLDEKASERKTIVFDDRACNVSFTQALPANIILPDKQTQEKRRTIIYENDTGNISVTQAFPANVILPIIEMNPEGRRTVSYEDDTSNISVTQALPANIIEKVQLEDNKKNYEAEDILTKQSLPTNLTAKDCETSRRRTIVFANDTGNISISQAIPAQLLRGYSEEKPTDNLNTSRQPKQPEARNKKRTTIGHGNGEGDISITEAIPHNIIEKSTNERKTTVYDEDEANISVTLSISANDFLLDKLDSAADIKNPEDFEEVKATDYDVYVQDNLKPSEDGLQVNGKSAIFDANNLISEMTTTAEMPMVQSLLATGKKRTVVFGDDNCDISMTKPIPAEFITVETEMLNKTETKLEVTSQNQIEHPQLNVIMMQASTTNNDSKVELPIKLCNVDEVQVKSMALTTDQNIDKVFEDLDDDIIQTGDEERKESLIISYEPSFDSDTDDKSLMTVLESIFSSGDILMDAADNNSTRNRFYNTKACEDVIQTDNLDSDEAKTEKEDELEQVYYLQGKLAELQTDVSQNSDLSKEYVKQYDTQNLLDLISKWIVDSEDDVKPVAVKVKELGETTEHKRLSVAPYRQSAMSREDLLSNISMAQAAIQKSRLALDDSDYAAEDTGDASVDVSKNSGRKNNEIVKTLNFDDESSSETSLEDEEKYSPLKKTVFGETSYMNENKGTVIPKHIKYVSDRLKELMLDLVKPVSDNMPFQSGLLDRGVLEKTSTHSTLVQVNLTASSQIELISNAGVDLDSISSSASGTVDHPEKSKSRAFRNQVRFANLKETEMLEDLHSHSYSPSEQPSPPEVLIFDHLNPLNNILLAPTNLTYVHKYNPRQTVEMFCGSRSRMNNTPNGNNYLVETVTTTQFTLMPGESTKHESICVYKKYDQFSQNESTSTTSGRTESVDESVEAISMHLRDDEVNTLIAMRGNKELLQASSSLTLVDDLSDGENSKLTSINNEYSNHRIKLSRSPPVNIKGLTAEIDSIAESSGISLRDKFESSNSRVKTTKGMKWIYSPSTNKHKHYSPPKEVTPKPITKIFRNSKSHKVPAKISSSASGTVDHPEKSKSRAFRNQVRFACLNETAEERHLHSHLYSPSEQPPPSDVLVFNHHDPLKNILLAPTNLTDVHKYNPRQTDEMLCGSRSRMNNTHNDNNYLVETVTTTQCTLMPAQSTKQDNIYVHQNGDQFSQNDVQFNLLSTSSTSGRTSVDDSVEAISKHLRAYEVNTLIALRDNTELLRASPSLTLVDDLTGENSKLTSNNKEYSTHRIKLSRSPPANIKGQTAEIDSIAELSGISLRDSFESSNSRVKTTKGMKIKRIYSPTNKHKHYSPSKELTPKLITKMQKISRSPKPHKVPVKIFPRNGSTLNTQSNNQKVHQSKKREKKLPKANNTKSGQTITVQQLITDYQNLETELKHNNNSKKKLDDLNLNRTDSGVNVVAKIDMLAFMGSHECEWDSKSLADTWSFRLQHRRLRLTTRLAHRHHNATRTHVRGDTPVLDIEVETVQHDRKNPLATLCVRFACETIRYMVSHRLRTPCCAKDIPQLLRRCAAVVRVALRWGRAMHDAKSQLAYTLDSDGNLLMKVADVRLRSVWEVTMRIDLVVDNTHSVPWPKASGVRVSRLVPELLVPDTDVRCDLSTMPRDWRHAPRTIW